MSKTINQAVIAAVGTAFQGLDSLFTSKEERLNKENEVVGIVLDAINSAEGQRTTRHANDMSSDSTLSKAIRPASLIYLLLLVTVLAIADSTAILDFAVKPHWVELFSNLLEAVFSFYFLARGAEKIMSIYKGMDK